MSFPNYSTLFTLGLMAQSCGRPESSKSAGKRPLRSFLKLDLVDAFPAVPRDVPSAPSSSPLPKQPSPAPSYMPLPPTQRLHRRSRDSLRTIPSPKPAPLATLPPSPALLATPLSTPSPSTSSAPLTPPQSFAPALPESVLSGLGLDFPMPPKASVRPVSAYSAAMSSVASPRRRLASRSAALALLEGRRAVTMPTPRRPSNFMSMSDDEDDEPGAISDADDEDSSESDDDEDEIEVDDWPAPPRSAPPLAQPASSFLPAVKPRARSTASLPASTRARAFADSDADEDPQRGGWRSFIDIDLVGVA